MDFFHVDVFSSQRLSGNGLTVIFHSEELDVALMQRIAQEFKQFETIFLRETADRQFRARIFTVEEELDFAGHPVIGAASALHEKLYAGESEITISFKLNAKSVLAESVKTSGGYQATMNQGVPQFIGIVANEEWRVFLEALNLAEEDLHPRLPMEVISTGLPYLIVPVASGLGKARICGRDFERLLSRVNAKFVYVLDAANREGRTWDNLGAVEDVATGSAAGPVGAYLCKWGECVEGEDIVLRQGRFAGRPSEMKVIVEPDSKEIKVSGDVCIIAKGQLLL